MQNKDKTLLIMIGNIGSGKSTLARKFQKNGFVIIQRDGLRYMIGGGYYVFNPTYEPIIAQANFNLFTSFVNLEVNLLVDETNVSKKERKDYIDFAKTNAYYTIKALVMPRLSKEESVKRRLTNDHGNQGREVWETVWQRFDDKYEAPSMEEGFNQIIEVKYDSETDRTFKL